MTDSTASVNGANLRYTDSGRGMPLICLHGGMGIDSASLRVSGLLDLGKEGVRLIIPDQRGHGGSSRHDAGDYTHAAWAGDIRSLGAFLGLDRFALLGRSYGGFVAMEYATRWPESLTHLILVATSAGPVTTARGLLETDEEVGERFRDVWPHFFSGPDKHYPLLDTLRFSVGPYNAAFMRELPRYDLRDRVAELAIPMMLIVGAKDHYLPHMQWLAEHARNARLRVIDSVGHFPFVEAPTEFIATVAGFLKTDFSAQAIQ